MNREQVIAWAKEAELHCHVKLTEHGLIIEDLQYFANLVAAAEREACAKVCEKERNDLLWREGQTLPRGEPRLIHMASTASQCANAIRARGEK